MEAGIPKRFGVTHQFPQRPWHERGHLGPELGVGDQLAVSIEQVISVGKGQALGEREHPELVQDQAKLVAGDVAAVVGVRVREH
jgi:hypothetical protein